MSDIAMPDIDGYELIARLRRIPGMAHVPAIAFTGFGRAQDRANALRAGYDGHLAKPVSVPVLLDEMMRSHVSREIVLPRPGAL